MMQQYSASIWQEGDWYIAQCLEIDIASQGTSRAEAIDNLREALQLHLTPPLASITPDITTVEVDLHAA